MEYDIDYEVNEIIKEGKLSRLKKIVSVYGFEANKNWQCGYLPLFWSLEHNRFNVAKWLLSQNCQVNPDCRKYSQKTALHLAVQAGKADIVRMMLERGARLDVHNDQLENPLHIGCKRSGNGESAFQLFGLIGSDALTIVKLLLQYGAPINDKGGLCEETPLLLAVKNGSKQHQQQQYQADRLARLLLEHGADVNEHDLYRKTALHVAVEHADRKMIKLLLSYRANVNVKNCNGRTPLHLAARKGCLDVARMLLAHGADVNDSIVDFEHYRWTALHIAVKNKDERMIRVLLDYRANVNAKEGHYRTPLHIAAVGCRPEIARILLEAGADVNDVDRLGQVPFHLAIRIEDERMVGCLLEHNPRINAKRKDGKSCLHFAAENQNPSIAKILLNRGADINDVTANGCTVLHFAAKKGSKELVELFLKLGIDVDVKTKLDDFTPLYYAVKKRRCQIAEYLLYHGADVDVPVKVYQTLLRLAVFDMNRDMVELLLNWNADINAEDNNDETPLTIATDSTRYEDIPGCERMRGIADCLVMYIAKLIATGVHVSEQNLKLIEQKYRLKFFYEQCRNELTNMRCKKIYEHVSYYDVLTKNTNTLVCLARNSNVRDAFETSDYLNAFPIYSSMMYKNYERAKVKKQLLDRGERALKYLFDNGAKRKVPHELPYVVCREILKYLGLKDLRILSVVNQASPLSY